MRYPRLAARLFNTPLLARASYARTVAHVLGPRMGVEVQPGDMELKQRLPYDPYLDEGSGVLTVPVVGGLYHRGDEVDAMSGAQSYTNLNNMMAKAMTDPAVKAILLDIDSPGGEAGGCFSFAQSIKAGRAKKPIWAQANSCACSAAYAIGTACERFYAAVDAEVGSVGVVWLHMDYSRALEKAGLVATYLYAGEHKTDGNPFEPMDDSARRELQGLIDERYRQFVQLVAANRPQVTEDEVRATQARVFLAEQAHQLGLVDGVQSLEATRDELARQVKPAASTFVQIVEGKVVTWQG